MFPLAKNSSLVSLRSVNNLITKGGKRPILAIEVIKSPLKLTIAMVDLVLPSDLLPNRRTRKGSAGGLVLPLPTIGVRDKLSKNTRVEKEEKSHNNARLRNTYRERRRRTRDKPAPQDTIRKTKLVNAMTKTRDDDANQLATGIRRTGRMIERVPQTGT